jgi:hypothetical protein
MGYICMIDKAMSGWGPCRDKRNLYVIQCETEDQMLRIERTARLRKEMRNIHRRNTCPRNTSARLVTVRTFEQVPGWHVDPVGAA